MHVYRLVAQVRVPFLAARRRAVAWAHVVEALRHQGEQDVGRVGVLPSHVDCSQNTEASDLRGHSPLVAAFYWRKSKFLFQRIYVVL